MNTRAYTLVLAGGGARGFAHAGVLRGLLHLGLAPAGLVGVSTGAIVAATYALRDDWYEALLSVDLDGSFHSDRGWRSGRAGGAGLGRAWSFAQATWNLLAGWGAPPEAVAATKAALEKLLGPGRLDGGRVPVTVCATDLGTGTRAEFSSGPAAAAVYASAALAGVLPPANVGGRLLVDGAYSDNAPIDLARRMDAPVVIAVDPSQDIGPESIENGLQALTRAMEICHLGHSHLRAHAADLVLRPEFGGFVDVLDFGARRKCVAAGIRAVRSRRSDIEAMLSTSMLERSPAGGDRTDVSRYDTRRSGQ